MPTKSIVRRHAGRKPCESLFIFWVVLSILRFLSYIFCWTYFKFRKNQNNFLLTRRKNICFSVTRSDRALCLRLGIEPNFYSHVSNITVGLTKSRALNFEARLMQRPLPPRRHSVERQLPQTPHRINTRRFTTVSTNREAFSANVEPGLSDIILRGANVVDQQCFFRWSKTI